MNGCEEITTANGNENKWDLEEEENNFEAWKWKQINELGIELKNRRERREKRTHN